MLTIYHAPPTRSVRIVWLAEELGLPYVEKRMRLDEARSEEFLAVNPLGQFPAIVDGDVAMSESVAIMQYLLERRAPDSDLRVRADEADFPAYLQFMHYGEAGLLAIGNAIVATRYRAPEEARDNWTIRFIEDAMAKRLKLAAARLQDRQYLAGDRFTAADISVGFALSLYRFFGVAQPFDPAIESYAARLSQRPAFQKAMAKEAAA
jgi:glutathione S-transferase